jgi:hypothetical protein
MRRKTDVTFAAKNPIDFQGHRSRSLGQIFRRGDMPRFALPLLHFILLLEEKLMLLLQQIPKFIIKICFQLETK